MSWKILYVGPVSFHPDSWRTRAEYILPDLFSSLGPDVELHLLTAQVPDFARRPLEDLLSRFPLHHHEVAREGRDKSRAQHWSESAAALATSISADVVTNVFGSQWLGLVVSQAAAASGAKAVVRVAGDEIGSRIALKTYENDSKRYLQDLLAERAGLLQADTVIAMSPWEASRLRRAIGVPTDKVRVCVRGIDLARFQPANRSNTSRRRKFLYVGRNSAEKGYDLIEAAARKVYESDSSLEFLFVGDFQQQVVENRRYLGWVETADLVQLYRSVDAFVLSSRSEGFPQVVAEAMASGLPCILSEHLFSGVFRHEQDALLCPLDGEQIARQILRLASDDELAGRLAARSRELAEVHFGNGGWSQRYRSLMHMQPVEQETVLDADQGELQPLPGSSPGLPRIAFITPRVFGMMGTLGSYGLAKAFSLLVPTLVISRAQAQPTALPIVADDTGLAHHERIDFSADDAGDRIAALLAGFRADVVHFVNDHSWVRLIPQLKSRFPTVKFVMDFKTPLLAEGKKREVLHRGAAENAHLLDLVVALSSEIARSWLPAYAGRVLEYPLGLELSGLRPRTTPTTLARGVVRCIYVGQLDPRRQLPKLLKLVSELSPKSRLRFHLDIYGAGGGEHEIDRQIASLGLQDTVRRKLPLPQKELFQAMQEYDFGVAWVPREVYNEAPSLKFLEYAATGLGIMASDTAAHRRNVAEGFEAILFEETTQSFAAAVEQAIGRGASASAQEKNSQVVRRFGFDAIARNVLLPEYVKLSQGSAKRDRLLFVTPRPLGLMATPGTYLSVEAYAEHYAVEVVAKPVTSPDEIIVHTCRKLLPVTLLDPRHPSYEEQVLAAVRQFQPHVVCLGAWPGLHRLVRALRAEFEATKLFLEIKSPIVNASEQGRERDMKRWREVQPCLDAIVAPSKGMAETYFGHVERPFLQHRSLIDFSLVAKRAFAGERVPVRRFVFSGSLAKLRRIDKLLRLLAALPAEMRSRIQVDFYGDGPVRDDLVGLAGSLGLDPAVRFLGAIPQADLFQRYAEYDAGIAWVPRELFDSAPSLKLIEYCAAGLAPLATSSNGHLLLKQHGFQVDYFEEDDERSFAAAMKRLCDEGVASELLQRNMDGAEKFDFRSVISNEIVPFYRSLHAEQASRSQVLKAEMPTGESPADPSSAWREQIMIDAAMTPVPRAGIARERFLHAKRMSRPSSSTH